MRKLHTRFLKFFLTGLFFDLRTAFFLFLVFTFTLPAIIKAQGFVVVIASGYNQSTLMDVFEKAKSDGLNPEFIDMKLKKGVVYRVCTGFFENLEAAVDLWDKLRQQEGYEKVWVLPILENLMIKMPDINREEFTELYNNVIRMINDKDFAGLNRLINPNYGFYVMINPGSFFLPVFLDSIPTDVDELFATGAFIYFSDNLKLSPGELVYGDLPVFNCETGEWSKDGKFVQGVRSFSRISQWEYSLLEYDDWDDDSVQKLRLAESKVLLRTIDTNGFEIDFAFEDGKWYIAAFDLATSCNQ
ncbi:MAG: hypothetical protein IFNCLDLE_00446 [Ignavibacteriaceae bacterium]|nr:hypothetical protein [Ignavibacteriaceae bacterium]OQY76327.1 MAG: hypothetical protein B6D45_03965 [Ignavibacteriales bacterium UTCHB3]